MKKTIIMFFAAAMLLLASCSKNSGTSGPYVPTAADATAKATLSELQQGRALYISNCESCHALPNPDDYTTSGWTSVLNSMAPRTSLSSSQVTLVYKYVTRGQ